MQTIHICQTKTVTGNIFPNQTICNEMEYEEAKQAAYFLGGQSYRDNQLFIPPELNAFPALTAAWREGLADTQMLEITHECEHCNNVRGDPCAIHD